MAGVIDPALAIQFSQTVHQEAQQELSRTRSHVVVKPMAADSFAYDGLGLVEAVEIKGRNQKVEFQDIEHLRRKISRRRFAVTLPIDSSDIRGMVQSQMNEYSKAIIAAMNREVDRLVVGAAFADVLTGRDFETTVNFATDGGLTVDATAGLTYEKLLEAAENFTDNEVGNGMDQSSHLYLSGSEETALMGETELTSGDFSRQYAVDKGRMTHAGQFQLTKFGSSVNNPVLSETGGVRSCVILAQRGICLGISKDISLSVEERNDYHETTQLKAIWEMGAVRTEGALIQKLTTTV